MTYNEAIALADAGRCNEVEPALKLFWLSRLDLELMEDLILTRAEPEALLLSEAPALVRSWEDWAPPEPDEDGAGETTALACAPHDALYPAYLKMQIDLAQGELELYNNDAAVFAQRWNDLARAINRRVMQQGPDRLRF